MAERIDRAVCPHDCPSVCALEVRWQADGRLGRLAGSTRNPYTAGVICAKVARYAERLHHPERLTRPLLRAGPKGSGRFRPVSWEEALDRVAEAFLDAERRFGSESVWPYYYAGTMGLVQRDGINRLTHVKRYSRFDGTICVRLADVGFKAGAGKRWGTPPEEIGEHSELVVVWGCNPAHTHVNLMTHIKRAQRRGARLVVVDPYRTATARLADLHLPLRPGTDGALACAVMQVLFAEGYADWDYLRRYTEGAEELAAHLESRTPEWAARITGLAAEQIRAFARLYGQTRRAYLRLGYGFTRSRNGAVNMHAVSCLPAVTGAWRYPGGGACYSLSDLYALDTTVIEGLDARDPSVRLLDQSQIGRILTGDPEALKGGPPVKAMLIQNTNPMCVAPELGRVRQGLLREDLFLCVHEQFLTATARMADVVLPATMFLEHDDIYTASAHGRLQISRKLCEPPGECRPNHWVIAELARRLGADHPGFRMTAWELIEDLLARSGLPEAARIEAEGGFDCCARAGWRTLHHLDGFPTPSGRFRFRPPWRQLGLAVEGLPELPDHLDNIESPSAECPYRLIAPPARHFLNTSFTETPSSRRGEGRPRALVHPDTLRALGLWPGDLVAIGNRRGALVVEAVAADGQDPGTVVVEGIWPNEAFKEGLGVNQLVSSNRAPPAGGAVFHDTAVWLRPVAAGPAAEAHHGEAQAAG